MFERFKQELARHRQRSFLEAVMAACALIASAGDEVSFSERACIESLRGWSPEFPASQLRRDSVG